MRILLVMDPGILIPPKGYGGHERLVEMFATEYKAQGHEVHLLVTEGSYIEGCIMHSLGKEGFPPKKWDARLAILKAWHFLFSKRNQFDIVHNFGRLAYLLPILNSHTRKIMTYGREISRRNIQLISKLPSRNLIFTGCSADLVSRGNVAGIWKTVYNAIDFNKYTLQSKVADDAPLIFLGRIEKVKGCHNAIKVAKETNNKLLIAGNISPLVDEEKYFREQIEPNIDGVNIQYIGPLNDKQKNEYLGKAKALLFPIEWNEPFGMVMVEAMACGTPVIAFNKGSVKEVVENKLTGFIVEDGKSMANAIMQLKSIDRNIVRSTAKEKFDVTPISNQYLQLFD